MFYVQARQEYLGIKQSVLRNHLRHGRSDPGQKVLKLPSCIHVPEKKMCIQKLPSFV